jgi:hypothetical protein
VAGLFGLVLSAAGAVSVLVEAIADIQGFSIGVAKALFNASGAL